MKITEKIITDDQRISKTKGVKRTITQNDNLFNINPSNSGILVSLARILAKDQICGCLYIDERKNIYFASNLNSTPTKSIVKIEKVIEFLKDLIKANENYDSEELEGLIETNSKKNDLLKFFIENFVKEELHKYKKDVEQESVCGNDKSKLIANLAEKIFDSEDWSLENFETLKKKIENYFQDLPSQNNRFRNFLIKVMIFLQDLENLFEITKESKEENENENKEAIVKSLLRKKGWFERAKIITTENNALISKTLHCECRMLEHVFNKFSDGSLDEKSWKKFVDAFLEKRIAISKPCCFYCHLLLISLEISFNKKLKDENFEKSIKELTIYGKKEGVSKITRCLGSSGRVFSWTSPSIISEGLTTRKIENVRKLFQIMIGNFQVCQGSLDFINETSESLEFQVEYNPPKNHVNLGWLM